MVKPINTYVPQKRLSWYGQVLRRDDNYVAKEVITMKGGKRPRGRPILKWMGRVRSDMKEHQLDQTLAQNREAWRNVAMAIDPGEGKYRQR